MVDGTPRSERGGEHGPLVRLGAIFYFMSSSMLVQFTTKVRLAARAGLHHCAATAAATVSAWRASAAWLRRVQHPGPAFYLAWWLYNQRSHLHHAAACLPVRVGQIPPTVTLQGGPSTLRFFSSFLLSLPCANAASPLFVHHCAGRVHKLWLPLPADSGTASNGLHCACIVCGGTAAAVVGPCATVGAAGHGECHERGVRPHR